MTSPKKGKHSQLGNALLTEVNQLTLDSLISHNVDANIANQVANHLRNAIAASWGGTTYLYPQRFPSQGLVTATTKSMQSSMAKIIVN